MIRCAILAVVFGSTLSVAEAADPPHTIGVGYKAGNGIGMLGADIVYNPAPHWSIDVQMSYLEVASQMGAATGEATAPSIQYRLFAAPHSSPYLGVGMQFVSLSTGEATSYGYGAFANVGYEYKMGPLGLLLGAGVQRVMLKLVDAGDDLQNTHAGQTAFNIEGGVRCMFR